VTDALFFSLGIRPEWGQENSCDWQEFNKFRSLINKERRTRAMAMEIVLDLQKLEVPQEEDLFGSSTGSSSYKCCNGSEN